MTDIKLTICEHTDSYQGGVPDAHRDTSLDWEYGKVSVIKPWFKARIILSKRKTDIYFLPFIRKKQHVLRSLSHT